MKSKHQQSVESFMRLAEQDVPESPTVPSVEVRLLRAKIILEEALETIIDGLGIQPFLKSSFGLHAITSDPIHLFTASEFNMSETIDGCCDLAVVTTGTLLAIGVPDEPFQDAVNENNLAKFGPGGHRRDDGKWVKPPGHKPPDISGILASLKDVPPAIFNRLECPFHYCDQPAPHDACKDKCRHA